MNLFPEDILPTPEPPPAEPVPAKVRKKKSPKPEVRIKIVYKEPEISDRQLFYRRMLNEAIRVKQRDYQKWATHVTVQSSKVFTAASTLMHSAMQFKELRPVNQEEYEQKVALAHEMKAHAIETMAAAIRFLERLKIPQYDKESTQTALEQSAGEQQADQSPHYSTAEAWHSDGVEIDESGEYRDNGVEVDHGTVHAGEDTDLQRDIPEPSEA